jgi:hypothetical protein
MESDTLKAALTGVAPLAGITWSVKFLFVAAALEAIGILISIRFAAYVASLGNYALTYGGTNKFSRRILWVVWFIFTALIIYFGLSICVQLSLYAPAPRFGDAALAVLTGAAFGTLTARFVWRLFGPNFRITEAIVGAGVFVLLSLAYSLPVYEKQILQILHGSNITSLKTPVGELTFAEQQTRRPIAGVGAQAALHYSAAALPHPSDPTPGLEFLDQDASDTPFHDANAGFLEKDKVYIEFFSSGTKDEKARKLQAANETIEHAKNLLKPLHSLSRCLKAYVKVVRDAELLAVDLKQPVLERLFALQNYVSLGKHATSDQYITMWEQSWKEWQRLQISAIDLIANIHDNFGKSKAITLDEDSKLGEIDSQCALSAELETMRIEIREDRRPMEYLTPLQPYVAIALSSLLMAIGSPDEGIEVLAKWLDAWSCARGEKPTQVCDTAGLGFVEGSEHLPEWFRYRAEFQLNVLLYQLIGANNIIYRDFIKKHSDENGFVKLAENGGVTINLALDNCENYTKNAKPNIIDAEITDKEKNIRVRVLQLLLDDENSFLMAQRNFLYESDIPELENLYRRARRLVRFTPECIEPRDEEAALRETTWKPVTAGYEITAGLLGVAVGERMSRIADSAYDRRRAEEIKKASIASLRKGRNLLKELRDQYRDKHANDLFSEHVFTTFPHEDAFASASQAIERLNSAEP